MVGLSNLVLNLTAMCTMSWTQKMKYSFVQSHLSTEKLSLGVQRDVLLLLSERLEWLDVNWVVIRIAFKSLESPSAAKLMTLTPLRESLLLMYCQRCSTSSAVNLLSLPIQARQNGGTPSLRGCTMYT